MVLGGGGLECGVLLDTQCWTLVDGEKEPARAQVAPAVLCRLI